jgi:hypothetical protein
MAYNLSPDQRRLIEMYVSQYNHTNQHIEHLLDMLDDIRSNIQQVVVQGHQQRPTRNTRNTNFNRYINDLLNTRSASSIYYDYNNPIDRNVYTNRNRNNGATSQFLNNFLNSTVPIRPTQDQIENASRVIRYGDIVNPISSSCPISLDPFTNDSIVRQICACNHIFHTTSFNQWFMNNVRCPVCRYDIRDYRASEPAAPAPSHDEDANNSTTETTRNRDTINNMDSITRQLFNSFISPLMNQDAAGNDEHFLYDASNNILLFETIIRPNYDTNP